MLAIERRQQITDRLLRDGRVAVRSLAGEFGVSDETIRRDLERLEREGLAARSYGGAVLKDGLAARSCGGADLRDPFAPDRSGREQTASAGEDPVEEALGALLADGIADGEHLFLEPGTLAASVIRALRRAGKKDLTLLSNAGSVLLACDGYHDWEVISLGGTLQSGRFALAGPQTIEWIGRYHADKAVVSCGAIDRRKGVTDEDESAALVKRAMLDNAVERIVAVRGTGFGRVEFAEVCGTEGIDTLVTDTAPSAEWQDYLTGQGIPCLYP